MKLITALALSLFAVAPLASAKDKSAGKGTSASVTFKVGADAKIGTEGNKKATLADLKVGDKISLAYEETGGEKVISRIRVASGEKKRTEGEKKGAKKEGSAKKEKADTAQRARGAITALDAKAGTLTADVRIKKESKVDPTAPKA